MHHCLANVMYYGPVEELARKLGEKTKQVLFVPQYKPLEARGAFQPHNKFKEGRHVFGAVSVQANETFHHQQPACGQPHQLGHGRRRLGSGERAGVQSCGRAKGMLYARPRSWQACGMPAPERPGRAAGT